MQSKSMIFPTPHIGYSKHGLFFTRLDCQSNDKPSEKDHDLPGIRNKSCLFGAIHVLETVRLSRYLSEDLKLIVDPVIQRNGYYGHSESEFLVKNFDSILTK
jgi:hypothetical protein